MAKDEIMTIYPKDMLAVVDGKIHRYSAMQKGAVKLTRFDLIEKRKNYYLFIDKGGFTYARKDSQGNLKVLKNGDWFELLRNDPSYIKIMDNYEFRNIEFVKKCYESATLKYDEELKKAKIITRNTPALVKKREIQDMFYQKINEACSEIAKIEKISLMCQFQEKVWEVFANKDLKIFFQDEDEDDDLDVGVEFEDDKNDNNDDDENEF